jgi:hypothetical protein
VQQKLKIGLENIPFQKAVRKFAEKGWKSLREFSRKNTLKEDFNMIKCSICGKDENSLIRVKHRKLGTIKLCFECWEVEMGNNNLLRDGFDCCK